VDVHGGRNSQHLRRVHGLDHDELQLHSRQHRAQGQGPQAGGPRLLLLSQVNVRCGICEQSLHSTQRRHSVDHKPGRLLTKGLSSCGVHEQ
jgi:hypothetical protein